jgi:hypothetical protein
LVAITLIAVTAYEVGIYRGRSLAAQKKPAKNSG